MKLKKPSRNQAIALGVVALVGFGLFASRSAENEPQEAGRLDAPARQACDDFERGYADAETKAERLRLADDVMTSTRKTDNEAIRDRAADMGLRASDGGSAWRSTADALTAACRDAGWQAP